MLSILLCVNSDVGRKNTIGFRFGKIAKELNKRDVPFKIIARNNYDPEFFCVRPWYRNYIARLLNAIRIYVFPKFDSRFWDVFLFDRFVLKTLKQDTATYDVAHLGEFLPQSIAYLKTRGVRVILDIPIGHDSYSLYLKRQGLIVGADAEESPAYVDRSICLADLLLVPSEFVKETLNIAQLRYNDIVMVPFGADVQVSISDTFVLNKDSTVINFMFAGNVNHRKGIMYLLNAWDKLPYSNIRLIICGRVYKEIQREIKNRSFSNVSFVGFVNTQEYFKQAHVFVLPTLLEGSAKAIYEAMSFGLPVITTLNAGSIVEDGKTGCIVPVGNVDALIKSITFFASHPDKIKEMGLSALQSVQRYTWDVYADNVVNLYEISVPK